VIERPETRFAWSGDVSLAYQILGEGPTDLVYFPGWASNVDVIWESPPYSRFLRRLGQGRRLVVTDRRGWGCSDRFSPGDVPPIETLTEDLGAVMDAAGSTRAAVLTTLETSIVACLYAATYPERVSGLILADPLARYEATEDMPWLPDSERWEEITRNIHDHWGTRDYSPAPYMDDAEQEWFARLQRASFGRGAFESELNRYRATDIRGVLPAIHVPTLILVDADSVDTELAETGRFMAREIPGAKLVELRCDDRWWWYSPWADGIAVETDSFLATVREEEASFERTLATVVFTDIVGSAEKAAALGDREWRELVERHHAVVRAMLARYRGSEVDTAGDGFFATFDGPARAVRCAQAIVEAVRPVGVEVRAGVHTGEVEAMAGKAGGLAVVIGSRVSGVAEPSEVLVSQTVRDLTAGSGIVFEDVGEHELKGVPDRWRLFRVAS
jgi:class 3 adenylate cyclase/pimeloyl-ACP methyl ester carboxylesterase